MSSIRKTGARHRVLKAKSTIDKAHMSTLLEFLGVDPVLYRAPANSLRRKHDGRAGQHGGPRMLWGFQTDQHDILRQAREGWLRLMKTNHPDRAGQIGLTICRQANECWARVKRVFAAHGVTL